METSARSDKDGGIGDESNIPRKHSEVTDSVTRQSEEVARLSFLNQKVRGKLLFVFDYWELLPATHVEMFTLLRTEFGRNKFAKPYMCRVIIPLTMPHHPQDEGRQSQGLGARPQIQVFAEFLNDRFLDAGHQVARRHRV